MIIRWIKNLEDAAREREKLESSLDGERMTPAEQKKASTQITKLNRDIERYAERINDDLKRAAEKRVPVKFPRNLESIHDKSLRTYLQGVSLTIGKLNDQIRVDGQRGDVYARQLLGKEKDADKLAKTAKQNEVTLKRELVKLSRREKDAQDRVAKREKDLAAIRGELSKVEIQRKKCQGEIDKVADVRARKQNELRSREEEHRGLESQKHHEQNRDRRDQMKARLVQLEGQLTQMREFLGKHLNLQAEQLQEIMAKIMFEKKQLHEAVDRCEGDLTVLRQELDDIAKARKAMQKNLGKEEDRRLAIEAAVKDMRRTQAYAKKYGILAK